MASRAKAAVIGAGPAALAAARRLIQHDDVGVTLIAPGGSADLLAGVLPVLTSDRPVDDFRRPVSIDGVQVVAAPAESIRANGVQVEGQWMDVDVVIAAPGLALDHPVPASASTTSAESTSAGTTSAGSSSGHAMFSLWDLDGAHAAAPAVAAFERGVIDIVISSPLYRCPPAPYGLAMRLATRATSLGLDLQVRLSTPEPRPLAAIGSGVSEFLDSAARSSGVEIRYEWAPDIEAMRQGRLVSVGGEESESGLVLVIPPHHVHPLLADLVDPTVGFGQLVPVDANGCAANGVFVAGDAVASPFPRASAPAVMSGLNAAEGALARLGIDVLPTASLPEPDCFVDRGSGDYSRIHISYPDGAPPAGAPHVVIGEATPAATGGFDDARQRWAELAGD